LEGNLLLGHGVTATGITNVVSQFLENELLSLNSSIGFTDAQSESLAAIEQIFPLTGGIQGALDGFFGAVSDLASNPGGMSERINLIGKARVLGDTLREARGHLEHLQSDLDKKLLGTVGRVNEILPKIASLNAKISLIEASGDNAGDFRGQRQVLLQEISHLTGATVLETGDGQLSVQFGGLVLVNGDRFASLSVDNFMPNGLHRVDYVYPDGTSFDVTSILNQGEIGGVLSMRDTEIVGFIDKLDLMAKTLVDAFNTQHALGFDATGTLGGNFFNPIASVAGAAANVAVNSAVVDDPRLIAAAETSAGAPGDNRNALALVNLQSDTFGGLGGGTLKEYFLSLVEDVGLKAQSANDTLSYQESLLSNTQSRRDGFSGVNTDEEMTHLILFQRAFEASARVITTADSMYETLIQMLG